MKRIAIFTVWCVLLPLAAGADWLHFHGDGSSASPEKGLPDNLSAERVAWKSPLPGRGPSSPIVVAGRVFVTAASGPRQDRLHLLAIDAATGKRRWERQLWATGPVIYNPFGGIATPTPASNGRRVVAFYSSNDLACFDLDGNLKWLRGLSLESPTTRNDVGMASSPVIVSDTVVVQLENQGQSFAAGIDLETGQTRWQIEREHHATWTSPLAVRGRKPGEEIVLLQSNSRLTAHEPRTGKQLWCHEAWCHTIASAAVAGDCIYLPAGGGVQALRCDLPSQTVKVLWDEKRIRCDNASPAVYDGRVYAIKSPAILVWADAGTGNLLGQLRLKGPIWSTPVVADGRLVVVNHAGLVQVVRLRPEPALSGEIQIDPEILASPAVADEAIYLRSNSQLWKIGEK